MVNLSKTDVQFNEDNHTYMLDGKRLMGITGLIHAYTGLGCYPDADDYVKNIAIPKAGARGTALHNAIEMYDTCGIEMTQNVIKWKEGLTGIEHEDVFDVSFGLSAYKQSLEASGLVALANEYTVTDGLKWASNIDNIWCKSNSRRYVTLVDTKTNNLDLYPGGKDALQQYLSWQLSIYAYLFEKQNPKVKVSALGCNWINKDKAEYWNITRLDDKEVEEILSCTWTDTGRVKYYDKDGNELNKEEEKKPEYKVSDDENELLNEIYAKTMAVNELTEQLTAMKEKLMQIMSYTALKSIDRGDIKITYTPESTSQSFDSKRFKAEHADLYAQYEKQSIRKGSIKVTIR